MSSLFALTGEYNQLYDMMTETEEPVDEEVIKDTMDAIMGEIEVKSEGYIAVMNRLDMEIQACKSQKEAWAKKQKVRENMAERLKERLIIAMTNLGKDEITAGDVTIKLQPNSVAPVIIDNEDAVPKEYKKVTVEEKIDKTKIGNALKSGKKFDWAHFGEKGNHIRIK